MVHFGGMGGTSPVVHIPFECVCVCGGGGEGLSKDMVLENVMWRMS